MKIFTKVGFLMNIVCVIVNMVAINTYGLAMFNLNEFPDWANNTVVCAGLESYEDSLH